ncbi:MAG: hypothetical protein K8R67_12270, partial [Desulfobacteraceae bacterium]|nr:hypothetical protein [Desulfobacteraceae bacterium]
SVKSEPYIYWKWNEGSSYWGYPLSVDGHIFSKQEILFMVSVSEFTAPNSLEIVLQSFQYAFLDRFGASFPISKIVNVPLNRVQDEYLNKSEGYREEDLLSQWDKGYRFKYEELYEMISNSPHEDISIKIIKREH